MERINLKASLLKNYAKTDVSKSMMQFLACRDMQGEGKV
jgi:hypothetical protein